MQWLVTGSSSGLGLELTRTLLSSNQKCIASSRNPAKTPEAVAEIEKLGGVWIALDTTSPDLEVRLQEIIDQYGPIDALINNAGYATGGPLETMEINAVRNQLETNLLGPLRAIQTLIPSMRSHKHGVIVNVTSAEFWEPHAGVSVYSASKFAFEGLSEALATELSAFNIRILIVEPGGMRTRFVDPDTLEQPLVPEPYKGTITDSVLQSLLSMHGKQDLDPKKAAEAIVQEVLNPCSEPPVLRLPLGKESHGKMKAMAERLVRNADVCEMVAVGADFGKF